MTKQSRNKNRADLIYPLPSDTHVIYAADSILPWGPVNFVLDEREERTKTSLWVGCGRFFATAHPWNEPHKFVIKGCSSLPELEEKVYEEIFKGDWDVMEKLMTGGASARLEEYSLQSVTKHTSAKSPRRYFESVGKYFVKPRKFDLVSA